METKVCINCLEEKKVEKFRKNKNGTFGPKCKRCGGLKWNLENKEYRQKYDKEYYKINKEKKDLSAKKSLLKHKDKYKKVSKIWYEKNKKSIIKRKNKRAKDRMKTEPLYCLSIKIRWCIKNTFKKSVYTKNSKTQDILGISFNGFKTYIENQFTEGMSWNNHGEWHLDHKIPISWAKTEDDIYKLNHYTNFQPLWAYDNLLKGNKYAHVT